jgi:hypothetical protein
MVDDRRRFTPRTDARGVAVIVVAGLAVAAGGLAVIAAVVLLLRGLGIGS